MATARTHPPLPLAPGAPFGRYEIVRALGQGGMGVVYEARHVGLSKRVAVKVLHPDLAWNEEARHRFLREGELAARIRHHNVVDVHDIGMIDDLPYLLMEFLEGEDLGCHLTLHAPLPVEATLDILLPVILGLSAGHSQGIIHRDLKPQNIFLARGGNGELVPKVLDFGVSKLIEERGGSILTLTGAVCGTVQYMSPEQARGARDIGPPSDQYALGAILYECVTGHQAYPGQRTLEVLHRVAASSFPPPRKLLPTLPAEIERVILRAMNLDPLARFDSVMALGRALLPFGSLRAGVLFGDAFSLAARTPVRTLVLPTEADPAPEPADSNRGTAILPARVPLPTTASTPPAPVRTEPASTWVGPLRRYPHLGVGLLAAGALAVSFVLVSRWGGGDAGEPEAPAPPVLAPDRAPRVISAAQPAVPAPALAPREEPAAAAIAAADAGASAVFAPPSAGAAEPSAGALGAAEPSAPITAPVGDAPAHVTARSASRVAPARPRPRPVRAPVAKPAPVAKLAPPVEQPAASDPPPAPRAAPVLRTGNQAPLVK